MASGLPRATFELQQNSTFDVGVTGTSGEEPPSTPYVSIVCCRTTTGGIAPNWMVRSKDRDALTPDDGGAGRGAVAGASGAGVGRDPVFGAVGLRRAEKGGVFILDAGTVSRGIADGASAACTGRTVSVNLFGLRGNPPSGGVATESWGEDNVLILGLDAAGWEL